jgi:hypothetical protein
MPVTLNEILEQHKDELSFADDAAKAAAVNALKLYAKPVYEAINNLAYGAGQAKLTEAVTAAKAEAKASLDAAEARAKKAEADLLAAQNKAPEVATINSQWETKLEEERNSHKTERKKLEDRIRGSLVQRDQATLVAELHEKHNVPMSLAKRIVKDPDVLGRWDYDDQGSVSVRQAGQQIPLAPGSGQTHLSLLAEELAGTVEDDLKISKADSGSGVTGGTKPGRGDQDAFFKGVAETAKKEYAGERPAKSLQERVANRG